MVSEYQEVKVKR